MSGHEMGKPGKRKVSNVDDLPVWLFIVSGMLGAFAGLVAVTRSKLWTWQSFVAHALNMGCVSSSVAMLLWWRFGEGARGFTYAGIMGISLVAGLAGLKLVEFVFEHGYRILDWRAKKFEKPNDDEPNK